MTLVRKHFAKDRTPTANCLIDSGIVFRKLMDHLKKEKDIEIEVTSESEDTSFDEYFDNVISKFL